MSNTSLCTSLAGSPLLGTYRPLGPVFVAGEGSHLIAESGERFLDLTSGIAVNALGHGDQDVARAVRSALDSGLIHTSNLFRTRPAHDLAEWLVERSFADRVFFCNSGAEANEGAIKFARRWSRAAKGVDSFEIVAFKGGFHGRTLGALSVTDRPAYQEPFLPLVPGIHFVEPGDLEALGGLLEGGRVAAVIIEPIQGEGGVVPIEPEFLRGVRRLCDETETLLIFDEVQIGLGRTGTLWAHEGAGVAPDLLTIAKPLAGGLPMGAVLLSARVADAVQPGDHATTFGGGPLVASAALAVCQKIGAQEFLASVTRKGEWLGERLGALALRRKEIRSVRGGGLLWGVETHGAAADVVARALDRGLLLCSAGPQVIRIVPALTIDLADLETGLMHLEGAL